MNTTTTEQVLRSANFDKSVDRLRRVAQNAQDEALETLCDLAQGLTGDTGEACTKAARQVAEELVRMGGFRWF